MPRFHTRFPIVIACNLLASLRSSLCVCVCVRVCVDVEQRLIGLMDKFKEVEKLLNTTIYKVPNRALKLTASVCMLVCVCVCVCGTGLSYLGSLVICGC